MKIDMKKALYCLLGLTFLQDSSADVTRLKLNQNVMNQFTTKRLEEFWINQNNGKIYKRDDGDILIDVITGDQAVANERLTHVVKTYTDSINALFDQTTNHLKSEYIDAIFCNNAGEIILTPYSNELQNAMRYLNEKLNQTKVQKAKEGNAIFAKLIKNTLTDIQNNIDTIRKFGEEIAKKQFENILRCGLLIEKTKFNPNIFLEQFDKNEGWSMPGISAFMKNANNFANVFCAMKTRCAGRDFWSINNYLNNVPKTIDRTPYFYSYEHTERQLMVNHLLNERLSVDCQITYSANKNLIAKKVDKLKLNDGSLFLWTRGNPCPSPSEDNGRICCMKWYREIRKLLGRNTYIYFSGIEKSGVVNNTNSALKAMILEAKSDLRDILTILHNKLDELSHEELTFDTIRGVRLFEKQQAATKTKDVAARNESIMKRKILDREIGELKSVKSKYITTAINRYKSYIDAINRVLNGSKATKDINKVIDCMKEFVYKEPIEEMFYKTHLPLNIHYKIIPMKS